MALSSSNLPHFVKLTKNQYTNLQAYNENTFYFATDTAELFVGSRPITSSSMSPTVRFYPRTVSGSLSQFTIDNVVVRSGNNEFTLAISEPLLIQDVSQPFVADSWYKTIVVGNTNHVPTSITDGSIILENTVRDQYKTTPYAAHWSDDVVYMQVFHQLLDGSVWTVGNSNGYNVTFVRIDNLSDYMTELRNGQIEALGMLFPIGSTIPYISHSFCPSLTWIVGGYDYKGRYDSVSEYCCGDPNAQHNVILVPAIAPSDSNGNHIFTPYDPVEQMSAVSVDLSFDSSKTYYTNSGCTTVYDTTQAGPSDTPASLGLYEKGRIAVAGNGCSRYSLSFIRRWLNSIGSNWYTPIDIFEPASVDFANTWPGFLGGLSADVRQYIHRVNQRYKNHLSTSFNNYDLCQDLIWLPSELQLWAVNNISSYVFPIFKNSKPADMIFYSANHVACYSYTGSAVDNNSYSVVNISLDGKKSSSAKLYGGGQMKDTSYPCMCLA